MSAFWQEHRLKKVSKGSGTLVPVNVGYQAAKWADEGRQSHDDADSNLNVRS
ncbi:hypothetical protein [Mesorhizobium sp.]|uniref:hypothetical protein n=1 Tax=Mesorhizobium sp. TaxID=1871066 RepID=UPI0025801A13|nr:hypothetical protein [Mesorhizobium sp.]